ncbi:MAG: saccharopine dehydrogenase NADP-binding domain-containing protein [Legionellales bacterium]|nr:saccharopine dehydrogenase NADP-binding domain-containing protein [Legionellales bacterium]
MTSNTKKHGAQEKIKFDGNILLLGFGSVGRALLPVFFEKLNLQKEQITIITNDNSSAKVAEEYGVAFQLQTVTSKNYQDVIGKQLHAGDFLVNLSTSISSASLIELCDSKDVLYIDTSNELWKENLLSGATPLADRTNYMRRESILHLKGKVKKTAIITHGANPGLASHFMKAALLNMAKDNHMHVDMPKNSQDWAALAQKLDIKAIHIAEHDTQISNQPKLPGEFVNTWSVDGFIEEGLQPAELGWGTHETHWPEDARPHTVGSKCAIYLERPGAGTKVRSWTPSFGAIHGLLITHSETITISNFLTLKDKEKVIYRPTVHYAYCACPDALLSIMELGSTEWKEQEHKRIIFNEIVNGVDELGVLLMGNAKGAYWYGSTLSVQEARTIAPYNNATSLQVVAGVLSAMLWAIEHPNAGLVEAEDLDHVFIMDIAMPYLGKVKGYYTDWTPLQDRGAIFPEHKEELDLTDPWQFVNIRVN